MDWDQGAVTSLNVRDADNSSENRDVNTRMGIQSCFREFLRNFREHHVFIYRDQLLGNYRKQNYFLNVNIGHITSYDAELQGSILKNPIESLPLLENAAKEALSQLNIGRDSSTPLADIQVILSSNQMPTALRNIHAQEINRLVKVPGIVISATKVRAKCVQLFLQCRNCNNSKIIPITSAYGSASIPRNCDRVIDASRADEACPVDSYVIRPDRCLYVDQQTLKLQENPEVVPTGEMPRSIILSTHRYLVDKVSPGTRVRIIGISSVFNSGAKNKVGVGAVALRTSYLRVVGIEIDEEGAGRSKATFSPQEEELFHSLARDPKIYDKIAESIAPSIYGDYTANIKKAIACQLFGGTRKRLPDGMMLRGDINVLLLGDPSTAKSQFLKFTEKVAPVGVYTSGKGSSAAGLTASVVRDAKGEFYLEGGAMVLADGGVVCIDEFDKMRESDRVAIHEAMEQQTISIAKAGITTILNSRTSVLAAANPIYGRYDDMRTASENIDLMSTILSRFDLIFIVRDIQDDERDQSLAEHVIKIHTNSLNTSKNTGERQGEIEPALLKRYITYCRQRCAPTLSAEAAVELQNFYISVRDGVRRASATSNGEPAIPVTVRQLEALIRVSESLAKMTLTIEATLEHVKEAIRLFRVSTMNASKDGGTSGLFLGFHETAQKVEEFLLQHLRIGRRVETSALYDRLEGEGFNPNAIQKAIRGMVQKGDLRQINQYKFIQREK